MALNEKHSDEYDNTVLQHQPSVHQAQGLIAKRAHLSGTLLLCAAWALFAALTFGFNNAIIASSLGQPNLQVYINLGGRSNAGNVIGCIAGFPNVGAIFGVPLIAWVADKVGRRKAVLFCCFWQVLGAALCAGAQNVTMLIVGRFFTGFGGWAVMMVGVLYAAEIAPATRRGFVAGAIAFGLSTGYVVAAWTGFGFFYYKDPLNWRIPFIIQFLPLLLTIVGSFIVPESPRWLVQAGKTDEALVVLKRLHHHNSDPEHVLAKEEHFQMMKQWELDSTLPSSWGSMFTIYKKRSWSCVLIWTAQEMTAVPVIASFGPLIYRTIGFSAADSLAIAGGWITMGVLIEPTSAWLSDRWGRKPIMIVSTIACCCVVLPIFSALQAEFLNTALSESKRKAIGNGAIAMIFMFGLAFFPQEPIGFLYTSEIFPSHIRTKGYAVGLITVNFHYIWITFTQPIGMATVGWKYNLVFILGGLVASIALFWFMVETKNVPLEEMAKVFGDEEHVAVHAEDIFLDEKGNVRAAHLHGGA